LISIDKSDAAPARPDLVDAGLRLVLEHRVGSQRSDELLADLVDGVEHADMRLAAAIGSWNGLRAGAHGLQWKAPLGEDVHWDGSHLTLPARMPDLVLIATTGRPLRDVFVHPALPGDRIVAEAMTTPDGIRIVCVPDMVAPASLIVARASADDQRRRREREHERLMRDATRMVVVQPPLQWRLSRIMLGWMWKEPTDLQIQETARGNAADIMRKACQTACDCLSAGPLHAQPLPLAA
jgi:hypothetical protein